MATKQEIVINIDAKGNITLQVEGVSGPECIDFTKFLEDELGDVTERLRTSAFYEDSAETEDTVESTEHGG